MTLKSFNFLVYDITTMQIIIREKFLKLKTNKI